MPARDETIPVVTIGGEDRTPRKGNPITTISSPNLTWGSDRKRKPFSNGRLGFKTATSFLRSARTTSTVPKSGMFIVVHPSMTWLLVITNEPLEIAKPVPDFVEAARQDVDRITVSKLTFIANSLGIIVSAPKIHGHPKESVARRSVAR